MSRGRTPVKQCTDAEWRSMCRRMRATTAPPEGYAWRFQWCESMRTTGEDQADCARKPGRNGRTGTMLIRIMRGISESETIELLIHEVAHAFDRWDHHGFGGDHSDTYFIWYGRIWRRYWGQE